MPIATQPPAEQTLLSLAQQAGQRRDQLAEAQLRGHQAQQQTQLGLLQTFMQEQISRDQMAQQGRQFQQQLGQDYRMHDETLGAQQTMFDAEHELAQDQQMLAEELGRAEIDLARDQHGLEETQARMGNLMGAMEGMLQLSQGRQTRNIQAQAQAAMEGRDFVPEGPSPYEAVLGNLFRQEMQNLGLAPEGMGQTQQGGVLGMTGQLQIPGTEVQQPGEQTGFGGQPGQVGSTGPGRFAYEEVDPSISGYGGLQALGKRAGDFARGLVFNREAPIRNINEALDQGRVQDIKPREFQHRVSQLIQGEALGPLTRAVATGIYGGDRVDEVNREMADEGLRMSRVYLDQKFNHLVENEGKDPGDAYNQAVREALPTENRRYFQAQFSLDEIESALDQFGSAQMASQGASYIQDQLQALGYRGPLGEVIDKIRTDIEQDRIDFVYPEQKQNMMRQVDRLGINIFGRSPEQPAQPDFIPTGRLTPGQPGTPAPVPGTQQPPTYGQGY